MHLTHAFELVFPVHYGGATATYFETPEPEKNFLKFTREKNMPSMVIKQGDWVNW